MITGSTRAFIAAGLSSAVSAILTSPAPSGCQAHVVRPRKSKVLSCCERILTPADSAIGTASNAATTRTTGLREQTRSMAMAPDLRRAVPVQDVADHRPSRMVDLRAAPENPVREQLVGGAVLPLQLDPGVDERGQAR